MTLLPLSLPAAVRQALARYKVSDQVSFTPANKQSAPKPKGTAGAVRISGFDPAFPADRAALLAIAAETGAPLMPDLRESRGEAVHRTIRNLLTTLAWLASEEPALWPGPHIPKPVWRIVSGCLRAMARTLVKSTDDRVGPARHDRAIEVVLAYLSGWERGSAFSRLAPGWDGADLVKGYFRRRTRQSVTDFLFWAEGLPEGEEPIGKAKVKREPGKEDAKVEDEEEKESEGDGTSAGGNLSEEGCPAFDSDEEDARDVSALSGIFLPKFGPVIGLQASNQMDRWVAAVDDCYRANVANRCDCWTRKDPSSWERKNSKGQMTGSKPLCASGHWIGSWHPGGLTLWEHHARAATGFSGTEAFGYFGKVTDNHTKYFTPSILADCFKQAGQPVVSKALAHWICPHCEQKNVLLRTPRLERTVVHCSWCTEPAAAGGRPGESGNPYGFDEERIRVIETDRFVVEHGNGAGSRMKSPSDDRDAFRKAAFGECSNAQCGNLARAELPACPICKGNLRGGLHFSVMETLRFVEAGGSRVEPAGDGGFRVIEAEPEWCAKAARRFVSQRVFRQHKERLVMLLDSLVDWWETPNLAPVLGARLPEEGEPVWTDFGLRREEWLSLQPVVGELLREELEDANQPLLHHFLVRHDVLHAARSWRENEPWRITTLMKAFLDLFAAQPGAFRRLLAKNPPGRDDDQFWRRLGRGYANLPDGMQVPKGSKGSRSDWLEHHPAVRAALVEAAHRYGISALIDRADALAPLSI